MRHALQLLLLGLAGVLATGASPHGLAHAGGDGALVVDADAGLNLSGTLFWVDAGDGARTILTDFGDANLGPTGRDPVGVVADAAGLVLVVDRTGGPKGMGTLVRVDPMTGRRSLISDFSDRGQGPTGARPSGLAMEVAGTVLVVDPSAGRELHGALFRVHPAKGNRKMLSDFGDPRQGPTGDDPVALALEASGAILVVDPSLGGAGALFRVDPATGARSIVSDFGDPAQGPTGKAPSGVAVERSGTILVVDPSGGPQLRGALFRVDPLTGARVVLSDFGDAVQGVTGVSPAQLAIEASGAVLVTDPGLGDGGALFRVDPVTGARTLLGDFSSTGSGPLGEFPAAVAVLNGTGSGSGRP
jgi:DNA-binding beta-propeller fold protein YncE